MAYGRVEQGRVQSGEEYNQGVRTTEGVQSGD